MMGPTWFLFLVAALYGVQSVLVWKWLPRARGFAAFNSGMAAGFLILGLAHLH